MTDRLSLYNKALGYVGAGRITSLTADRQERRELDAVYDGCLQYMLERAGWKFALRSSKLDADTNITPSFGLTYAYTLPSDFVRFTAICTDEFFNTEVTDHRKLNGILYTSHSTIYVEYVSNGASYGLDLGKYPETYAEALGAWMAAKAVLPISKDRGDRSDLGKIYREMLAAAKGTDAIDERVKWRPEGSWVRARSLGRGRPYTRNGRIGGF